MSLSTRDTGILVTSMEDLMSRLEMAKQREASRFAMEFHTWAGLPDPERATDADMIALKPLYHELIQDIRIKKEKSRYLRPLVESSQESPEAAILMAYFLWFPNLVRRHRRDRYESFDWIDISDELSLNPAIGKWYREAIGKPSVHHPYIYRAAVYTLCLHRFSWAMVDPVQPSSSKIKKHIRQIVFRNDDIKKGLNDLRSDLARLVLSRDDLSADTIMEVTMMANSLLLHLFDGNMVEVDSLLKNAANRSAFELALLRVRCEIGEANYQFHLAIIQQNNNVPLKEVVQSHTARTGHLPVLFANNEVVRCDREGCQNEGINRCRACRLANYCSRECQKIDWKARHKNICRGKGSVVDGVEMVASNNANPALRKQDQLLAQNPGCVYVVELAEIDRIAKAYLSGRRNRQKFAQLRQEAQAASDDGAVRDMYDMLKRAHWSFSEDFDMMSIVRYQLVVEYGVDPDPTQP